MTKRTTNWLGIIIAILAGIFFYLKLCSSCGVLLLEDAVKELVVVQTTPQPAAYSLAFCYGDYWQSANDNYNRTGSSPSILMPISQNVLHGIASLSTSLLENKGNVIHLTGYFDDDETNNSVFPNRGLAKANRVKDHMVKNGISSLLINTSGEMTPRMVPDENLYLGPFAHVIGTGT